MKNPTPIVKIGSKPVFPINRKTVINFKSAFLHKKLCDGITFSLGDACAYSCTFCYVPAMLGRDSAVIGARNGIKHQGVVLRREEALGIIIGQLADNQGYPKFRDPVDHRVVFTSPSDDCAPTEALAIETAEAARTILVLTHWQIRFLSKSANLPIIAQKLEKFKDRLIFGVSTGTLDDRLARCFEKGCAAVSKRIESLHWLQDNGFRTFGMACPSLPQTDPSDFVRRMCNTLRLEKLEHLWAEPLNARGASLSATVAALSAGGFRTEAERLEKVATDKVQWEEYARALFLAYANQVPPDKLRFMQYVTQESRDWWNARINQGAIPLGCHA